MFTKKTIILSSVIGLVILMVSGYSTAKATKSYFSATAYRLLFINVEPYITPSGNTIINQQVLWYDDATDDRLDGYDFLTVKIILNTHGGLQAHGTMVVREKLDQIPIENLINGNLNPDEIIQGEIIWEGSWTLTGDGLIHAVGHMRDGSQIFLYKKPEPGKSIHSFEGYILDPHGE